MSELQNTVLIVTAIVSILSLLLGVSNHFLMIKNRRNSLRERVYDKQFEFFMKFNEYTAVIDHELGNFEKKTTDEKKSLEFLLRVIGEFDLYVSKNEIIIPDILYQSVNSHINLMHRTITEMMKDTSHLNSSNIDNIRSKDIDLQLDIIDYLGLEKLSRENMEVARGMK